MNKLLSYNVLRFVLFALAQVLVFKSIYFTNAPFNYGHIFFYPLFILLVPIRVPRPVLIFIAFLLGFSIDLFYDSPGIHAGASVFTAYIRRFVLQFISPVEGYNTDGSPSAKNVGFIWFIMYASILMLAHLVFYFSVEAFSFVFFFDILFKTIVSFIFSIGFLLLHQVVFKTTY